MRMAFRGQAFTQSPQLTHMLKRVFLSQDPMRAGFCGGADATPGIARLRLALPVVYDRYLLGHYAALGRRCL